MNDQEPTMFLLEGVLTELNVELGRQNLLASILTRYKDQASVTGAAAVAGNLFGQAASAASLAMYDGEDTQNFLCLIDGQPMCGQFGGAEWLKPGNRVRAVVTKSENVLCAHAIMDEATGLLWITHPWGSKAEARANWKIAWWSYLGTMIFLAVLATVSPLRSWTWVETMLNIGGMGAVLMVVMTFWTGSTMRSLADPSTEMFRLLGFANPASVNLNSYRIGIIANSDLLRAIKENLPAVKAGKVIERPAVLDMGEYQQRDVYNYRRAIEDGKITLSSPSPR